MIKAWHTGSKDRAQFWLAPKQFIDVTEYFFESVDEFLEQVFTRVIFIMVCVILVSTHLTKRFCEALRVSMEVRKRRGAFLLKLVCALRL